jgi:hypothetical protein
MQPQIVMDENSEKNPGVIEGQLNAAERGFITSAVTGVAKKPVVAIEVGTWLGGGSTLPSAVCSFALRLLPKKFSRHLSDGRD